MELYTIQAKMITVKDTSEQFLLVYYCFFSWEKLLNSIAKIQHFTVHVILEGKWGLLINSH